MKQIKYILTTLLLTFTVCHPAVSENKQRDIDSLLIALHTSADTTQVNIMNEISRKYIDADVYDSALYFASEAKTLSEKIDYQKGIAVALNRLGTVCSEQGNYPKALEYLFASLKISEQLKDNYRIFFLYNGIGTVYYYQQDYKKALDYFFKAEKIGINNGMIYISVGRVYTEQNDFSQALNYFNKSLNYYSVIQDKYGISKSLNNIGCIYEYQNYFEDALKNYFQALAIMEQIEDNQGKCDALASIGDVYFAQGKYIDAIFSENKSLAIALQIGYLASAVETEKVLSIIYDSLNETTESYNHYKKYIVLRDSLFNEENTKRTVRAEMNYDFDKKQTEQKLIQDKKDAVNRIILYSVSGGLMLILLFAVFLFREYRAKKRANIIIAEQKRLVEEKQKDVMASIRYAKRIQMALMPTEKQIEKTLNRLKVC